MIIKHDQGEDALLGARVRLIREARNMSMQDLSDAAGISKTYIVRIETGNPCPVNLTLRTIDRLADALHVSPAWIAYGSK